MRRQRIAGAFCVTAHTHENPFTRKLWAGTFCVFRDQAHKSRGIATTPPGFGGLNAMVWRSHGAPRVYITSRPSTNFRDGELRDCVGLAGELGTTGVNRHTKDRHTSGAHLAGVGVPQAEWLRVLLCCVCVPPPPLQSIPSPRRTESLNV